MKPVRAVVIGASAGGIQALQQILPRLPADLGVPVIVVSHLPAESGDLLSAVLGRFCTLPVCEAEERAPIGPGRVYVAPADYHLLVEPDGTFALSAEARVNNVRPAIDLTLDSAAATWGDGVLAVLLSGANRDGAAGMVAVKAAGGTCIVQDPADCMADSMPRAAIAAGAADHVAALDSIASLIVGLCRPDSAVSKDCRP